MINYYKELGVKNNASKQEIKLAYLSMLKKYHPDVYDGDPQIAQNKTALLNECYQVLKDDEKRKRYDMELSKEQNIKSQDDYILKEFFRRFKTNIHNNNSQTKYEKKQEKTKVPKKVKEKKDKYITEDDLEKKENKKLLIYIFVIIAIIIGIITLCLIID